MISDKADSTYSEPQYSKAQNTQLPWWRNDIGKYLDKHMQSLLLSYSNIPLDQQLTHVHRIRDQAWARRTYPCIGLGIYLQPYIRFSPAYELILAKVKNGASFLDIGCMFGIEMRQLAFDGAPTENMTGMDIVSFWDLGQEMFRDANFRARYVECDVLKMESCTGLDTLRGNLDVVCISAVLHQWNWEQQAAAIGQIVKFSKVGTLVFGHQLGNPEGGEADMKMGSATVKTWKQSPETFARLWEEVGEHTGTRWNTQASMKTVDAIGWDPKDTSWMSPGDGVLEFVVTRAK